MPRTPKDAKTFTKDGKERTAYSPADAVALVFDGWVEKTETTPARQSDNSSAQRTASGGSASK